MLSKHQPKAVRSRRGRDAGVLREVCTLVRSLDRRVRDLSRMVEILGVFDEGHLRRCGQLQAQINDLKKQIRPRAHRARRP
jgi:hypothetical protein